LPVVDPRARRRPSRRLARPSIDRSIVRACPRSRVRVSRVVDAVAVVAHCGRDVASRADAARRARAVDLDPGVSRA
tara:strand:- start:74 stop:301 length:228 start_codon:yes stop_codon:yes gene_type:complete